MAIEKIENRKQLLVNLHSLVEGKKPLDSDNMPLIINGEIAVQNADGKLFIVDKTGSGLTEFANVETIKEMIIVSGGSSSAITALSGVVETLASAVTILNGDEEVDGSVAKQVKEGVVEAENFTKAALGDRFTESGSVMTPTVSEVIDEVEDDIEALSGAVATELAKKVDTTVTGENGTSRVFNEADGGGVKFEHKDGTEAFVGVNDGGEEGLMAQIYADKLNEEGKWEGAKIDVTNGGIYYTVGDKSFAERAVPENEIATKGDLAAIAASGITSGEVQSMIDEKVESLSAASVSGIIKGISQTDGVIAAVSGYLASTDIKIEKIAEPASGYASEYILVNGEGAQLGDKISITKDQFLKDAKFFAQAEDVPEGTEIPEGLEFPALYFIFETLEGDKETWVSVKGLVDAYTAGDGLALEENEFSVKLAEEKNYIKLDNNKALVVDEIETDDTILQQAISVTENVGQLKDGQVLESGMSVYDILVKMLSKEKWAANVATGKTFTATVGNPSVSLDKSGTVEVGTVTNATITANQSYTIIQNVSAQTFDYGYSDDGKATINPATAYTEDLKNGTTKSGDVKLATSYTGFTGAAAETVTATSMSVTGLTVVEGNNAIMASETAQTVNANTAVTPKDFYVATNLKNFSKSETDSSDWKVSITGWNGSTAITPSTTTASTSVTGAYKYYFGWLDNLGVALADVDEAAIKSASNIKSGWITKDKTTSLPNAQSTGTIVLAVPAKYKFGEILEDLSSASILEKFEMKTIDSFEIGGGATTAYKVYVYKDQAAGVKYKSATIIKA